MATIAAIKAVLLDKEKRANATKDKSEVKTSGKSNLPMSVSNNKASIKNSKKTSTTTTSSSAQSLTEAINNARKSEKSKVSSAPKHSGYSLAEAINNEKKAEKSKTVVAASKNSHSSVMKTDLKPVQSSTSSKSKISQPPPSKSGNSQTTANKGKSSLPTIIKNEESQPHASKLVSLQPSTPKGGGAGFSDIQVKRLMEEFAKKNILSKDETRVLALEIGLREDQVKRWFNNRKHRKQATVVKEDNIHRLKRVDVSVLMHMSDIMSLSRKESPEVVDILDDSLEDEDDDEISLLEVSKTSTISTVKENDLPSPAPKSDKIGTKLQTKQVPGKSSTTNTKSVTGTTKETSKNESIKAVDKTKVKNKPVVNRPSMIEKKSKETKQKECLVKGKVSIPELGDVDPNSKVEDLVEGLLRSIETLENELEAKETDLQNSKKDLEAVQATLVGKERVLNTVQESIPKVVSEHKNALQTKDDEITALKLQNSELQRELDTKKKGSKMKETDTSRLNSEHDKALLSKENEINELKLLNSKLRKDFEENQEASKKNDVELCELKLVNSKLQKQLESKINDGASTTSDEVLELKEGIARLEKEKSDIEVRLTNKLNESKAEADELKMCNSNLRRELDENLESFKLQLKKNEDERVDMKDLIAKCQDRIASLENDLGKKEDEVKILKYKEKQASSNETAIEETKKLLEANRKDTLALKDYERKLTRKITSLEFDLFTKTAESETQALVISRLNERIQSLQQESVKVLQTGGEVDNNEGVVLQNATEENLYEVDKKEDAADNDTGSEDDKSIIQGMPQTSPYVVNSSKKKRKRTNSCSLSDDEWSNTQTAADEPEFDSLCAEIETLCVPTERPLPQFSTLSDRKKMKVSDDVEDIAPTNTEDIALPNRGEDCYHIARSVVHDLLDDVL